MKLLLIIATLNIGLIIVVLITLFISQIFSDKKKLIAMGYSDAAVNLAAKQSRKSIPAIFVLLGLGQLLTSLIITRFFHINLETAYVSLIMPISIAITLPFFYLLSRKLFKEFKTLAETTGAKMIYDIKHKFIHKLINPLYEGVMSLGCFIFCLIFFPFSFSLSVYLIIIVSWYLYVSWKKSNHLTITDFQNNYSIMSGAVLGINLVLFMLIIIGALSYFPRTEPGLQGYMFAAILIAAQLWKLIFYFYRVKKLSKNLQQEVKKHVDPIK